MTIKFTELCSYTRGHGTEGEAKFIKKFLLPWLSQLTFNNGLRTADIDIDDFGNIWVFNGHPEQHPYLFAAHMDTCHFEEDQIITFTQGKDGMLRPDNSNRKEGHEFSCAGFDDGVGMYINLKMLEADVKGTYLFTRGEERGLLGANWIVQNRKGLLEKYKVCVEVDRNGTTEIITTQYYGMTGSEDFAKELAAQLDMGHKPSDEGIYTDNAVFAEFIPECVNLAAGYWRQHTKSEYCSPAYIDLLAKRIVKVDWERMPITREAGDVGPDYLDTSSGTYLNYNVGNPAEDVLTYDQLLELCKNEPENIAQFLYEHDVTLSEIYGAQF